MVASVGIIGTSHVGAHVADALIDRGLVSELVLCDRNEKLCRAQVNDLVDAMRFYPRRCHVRGIHDHYEELADCDIIVNAAGHIENALSDRDGELFCTTNEVQTFVSRVMDAGFKGIWFNIANPCEIVTASIQKLSGCDPSRVIGAGTTLDSARLTHALSRVTGYDQNSIHAWMLGEHGFSEFACFSHAQIGGLSLEEMAQQGGFDFKLDELEEQGLRGGYITAVGKSCTEYSIASASATILEAIIADTKLITPVSTYIHDLYGQSNIYVSVPCVLGKNGVEKIFMPHLNEREQEAWAKTCAHIKENMSKIEWLKEDLR